jgi:hypothetical protein
MLLHENPNFIMQHAVSDLFAYTILLVPLVQMQIHEYPHSMQIHVATDAVCRYTWCALTLCLPIAATKLVAPLVTSTVKRLPQAVSQGSLELERRVQSYLGPPRHAIAPFLTSAARVRASNYLPRFLGS